MTGTNDLHNESPTSSSAGQGPGRLVRQAREKLNLSIEDLGAQIKLARFTLDAIERDDFAQLNEPVYVRGYYRKLAKVLPVQEAELIAAYERVAGTRAPPHPSKLILAGGAELGSGRRVSLKLAVTIILIGVVVGALLFWGKNRVSAPSVTPAPVAQPAAIEPQPQPETAPARQPGETPAPPPVQSEVVPQPQQVETPPAAAAPSTPLPVASSATGQTGPLQMQFDGTSWTEVKDAAGKVLISGLVEAGSNQVLDGRPPFVVFLGNAPAVRIRFNGQQIDTAQFRRGDNTARIVLP
ncbi:MAG: RodZ domain-containing protein [Pseudomonadota bacterium]